MKIFQYAAVDCMMTILTWNTGYFPSSLEIIYVSIPSPTDLVVTNLSSFQ